MNDEGGVLENLPRSRPGQRSSKRSAASASASKKAKPAAKKAKPASKPKPRAAPAKKPPPVREEAESTASNPVGEVVRTVSSLAGGVAHAAREVLRRLPRP